MDLRLNFRTNRFLSIYVIFILIVGYLIIHIFNGRFIMYDFAVYYKAANRIASGQNLYQIVEDGHAIFKYSPVSAIYFIPFQWLSFPVAKLLYWICSGIAVCFVLLLIYRIAGLGMRTLTAGQHNLYIMISFIVLGAFLELEIHLGQVNIFILLSLLISLIYSMKNKPAQAGLALAISIFLKPFGLILAAWYAYRMKYKEVVYFIMFLAILFFLPLIFYRSFDMFAGQNKYWFKEIITELNTKQDLLAPRNHTLFSVLVRYTPLRWLDWNAQLTLIYQLIVLMILGLLMVKLNKAGKEDEWSPAGELGLLLCLIPLLAFTNRNLYMFNGLASAILLIRFRSLDWTHKTFFILGIMISSFNIIEIWGEHITYLLEDWSFITIGTMMIWVVLYLNIYRSTLIFKRAQR
jgi:hypothetical protein